MTDIIERLRRRVAGPANDGTADRSLLHEAAAEIERQRAYLLGIAQGTNEEWTHDWALRAIETSDPFEQPKGNERTGDR